MPPARSLRWSFFIVLLAAQGCTPTGQRLADGDDPLASLGAPVASQVYDLAFWAKQERQATPLWRAALDYCRTHLEERYPGCRNVRMASWWGNPPPPPRPPQSRLFPPPPPPGSPGGAP